MEGSTWSTAANRAVRPDMPITVNTRMVKKPEYDAHAKKHEFDPLKQQIGMCTIPSIFLNAVWAAPSPPPLIIISTGGRIQGRSF